MGPTVTGPYSDGMSPPPPRPLRDLPPPPGVTRVEGGVELCVYAGHADAVEVCLFDAGDREGESERRIPLTEHAHGFWFGHLRGVTPGQRYAIRASGPWQPEHFDAATGTLWTCQLTPVAGATPVKRRTALRAFDLSSGSPKLRWNLPGENSTCNDFALGPDKAANSLRLFMVPGMGHCGGGEGPNTFDMMPPLEQWVEQGKAPNQILASHSNCGIIDRTRPLCPYPQVAKYKGSGSPDDAANFVCQTP